MHRFSVELSVTTLFLRTMRRCACTQFEIFRFFFVCYRWVLVRAFWQILPISSMIHNQLHINGRWTEKNPFWFPFIHICGLFGLNMRILWLEHAGYWLENSDYLAWTCRLFGLSKERKKCIFCERKRAYNHRIRIIWLNIKYNRSSKLLHLQKNVVGFWKKT